MAKQGEQYLVSATNTNDLKYPDTYQYTQMKQDIDLSNVSKDELVTFLSAVTSVGIATRLVGEIENVVEVLENGDIDTLTSVNGVGDKIAERIINMYNQQLDMSPAIIAFSKYNLSETATSAIIKYFKNMDVAIKQVEENPYVLCRVPGFGFKRADGAFLYKEQDNPDAPRDKRRIIAFVDFLFDEEFASGNTWIKPNVFIAKLLEFIPQADFNIAVEYINKSKDYFTVNNNGEKRLAAVRYMEMELKIAEMIIDKNQNVEPLMLENVDGIIREVEERQGFEFDEVQIKAIHDMLDNNVYLLQGLSGSGKSSTIGAVAAILMRNGYDIGQTAISGRAANNLQQITGYQGRTIHSLIKYRTQKAHNEDNPMHYDVILLDEVSMVNAPIYQALMESMKENSKIILIGDSGQLDSIGAGVMKGIMTSDSVPSTTLKTIHRQAEKSAVITHSIAMRQGYIHPEVEVKSDTEQKYGENQDLEYVFVKNSEEDTIYEHVVKRFKESIDKYGVNGTQILSSTRAFTLQMNQFAQIIANPFSPEKKELRITKGDEKDYYILREGDKVMNVHNNYATKDIGGEKCPIFNGNTGTLLQIDEDSEQMIIEFDGIGTVLVPYDDKDNSIQLGYAVTVHKSQGSTIPSVIVALPFHFMLNSRELIYTAVTRASHNASIITSPKTLRDTVKKTAKSTQQTNLGIFLADPNSWRDKLNKKINRKGGY